MDKRILKVSFSKSGNGYIYPKIALPKTRLELMGVNPENREVEVEFDKMNLEFIIRKRK